MFIIDYTIFIQAFSLVGLAILFYKSPWNKGSFPEPLKPMRSNKKELLEAILFWGIHLGLLIYIFIRYSFLPDLPYFSVVIIPNVISIDVYLINSLVLPFIFLRIWKPGFERDNIGFKKPIDNKSAIIFTLCFATVGLITFFIVGGGESSLIQFLWWIITPVLAEELIYRAVITSKLERSLGIQKAWIIAGILFGLAHIPNDFFGYLW
ncbi:MAG: CPBP family intramembrane glutamic endopeptidase, partial [Promethearchaeota archaeon]